MNSPNVRPHSNMLWCYFELSEVIFFLLKDPGTVH